MTATTAFALVQHGDYDGDPGGVLEFSHEGDPSWNPPLLMRRCDANAAANDNDEIGLDEEEDDATLIVDMYESFVPWLPSHLVGRCNTHEDIAAGENNSSSLGIKSWLPRFLGGRSADSDDVAIGGKDDENELKHHEHSYSPFDVPPPIGSVEGESHHLERSGWFPQEAHSLARFHALSVKRLVGGGRQVNVGRAATVTAALSSGGGGGNDSGITTCAVLGMGILADFYHPAVAIVGVEDLHGSTSFSSSKRRCYHVVPTSDRDELLQKCVDISQRNSQERLLRKKSSSRPPPPRLAPHHSHVRVAAFGEHCRAVSWGHDDGIVRIYKRCTVQSDEDGTSSKKSELWVHVAQVMPSIEPDDIMLHPDLYGNQGWSTPRHRRGVIPCPSLQRISDIIPLLIPVPTTQSYLALLVMSRIGGSMEIVPIPSQLWCGLDSNSVYNSKSLPKPFVLTRDVRDSSTFWMVLDPHRRGHLDTLCLDAQIITHCTDGEAEDTSRCVGRDRGAREEDVRTKIVGTTLVACGTSLPQHVKSSRLPPSQPAVSMWDVNVTFAYHPQVHAKSMDVKLRSVALLGHKSIFGGANDGRWNFRAVVVNSQNGFLLKRFLAPPLPPRRPPLRRTTPAKHVRGGVDGFGKHGEEKEDGDGEVNVVANVDETPADNGDGDYQLHTGKLKCVEPVIYFTAPVIQLKLAPWLPSPGAGHGTSSSASSHGDRGGDDMGGRGVGGDRAASTPLQPLAVVDYYGGCTVLDLNHWTAGSGIVVSDGSGCGADTITVPNSGVAGSGPKIETGSTKAPLVLCRREDLSSTIYGHGVGKGPVQVGWVPAVCGAILRGNSLTDHLPFFMASVTKHGRMDLVSVPMPTSLLPSLSRPSSRSASHTSSFVSRKPIHILCSHAGGSAVLGETGGSDSGNLVGIFNSTSLNLKRDMQVPFILCRRVGPLVSLYASCSICTLSTSQIVLGLMEERKYHEALEVAKRFNDDLDDDTDKNNECNYIDTDPINKALWEACIIDSVRTIPPSNGSAKETNSTLVQPLQMNAVQEYLSPIRDDEYVLYASLPEYRHVHDESVLRAILTQGLERAKKLLDSDIQLSPKGDDGLRGDEVLRLRRLLNCLGTYTWFCQRWNVTFDASDYYQKFVRASILDFAMHCALRGDVDGLLLLFVRHSRDVVEHRLELLARLPPTLDPMLYRHLLPALPREEGEGKWTRPAYDACFILDSAERPVNLKELEAHFSALLPPPVEKEDEQAEQRRGEDGGSGAVVPELERPSPALTQPPDAKEAAFEENRSSDDSGADNVCHSLEESVARWYVERAMYIEDEGGCTTYAVRICDLGLQRLMAGTILGCGGVSSAKTVTSGTWTKHLISLRSCLFHFSKCLLDNVVNPTLSLSQWTSMEGIDIMRLILGENSDSVSVFSRWKRYIQPMMVGPYPISPTSSTLSSFSTGGGICKWGWWSCEKDDDDAADNEGNIHTSMELDLITYGLERVRKDGMKGLVVCAHIAHCSRTSLPKKVRMISNDVHLISFVLDCISCFCWEDTERKQENFSKYLETLWEMYECLPERRKERELHNAQLAQVQNRLDQLEAKIIAVDICARYCPPPPICHNRFNKNNEEEEQEENEEEEAQSEQDSFCTEQSEEESFCTDIVSRICNVFVDQAIQDNDASDAIGICDGRYDAWKRNDLVYFVLDLTELNRSVISLRLMEHALEERLLWNMLRKFKFVALRDVILAFSSSSSPHGDGGEEKSSISDPCLLIEPTTVERAIREFMNTHLGQCRGQGRSSSSHRSTDSSATVEEDSYNIAMACHHILGPLFPHLNQELERERQLMDASRFIREKLNCSTVHPSFIRSTKRPMKVIEKVLTENPSALFLGTEWGHPSFYDVQRSKILYHLQKIVSKEPIEEGKEENSYTIGDDNDLVFPGKDVLRLGHFLGLQSSRDEVMMTHCMIRHAIQGGYFGAATALSLKYLLQIAQRRAQAKLHGVRKKRDCEEVDDDNLALLHLKLEGVASVISADAFHDYIVRKELCTVALVCDDIVGFGTDKKLSSSVRKIAQTNIDFFIRYIPILEARIRKGSYMTPLPLSSPQPSSNVSARGEPLNPPLVQSQDRGASWEADLVNASESSDFLVFRAAGLVAKSAKNIVGQVSATSKASFAARPSEVQLPSGEIFKGGISDPAFRKMQLDLVESSELISSLQMNAINALLLEEGQKQGASSSTLSDKSYIVKNESTLVAMARHVVMWCISEASRIRFRGGVGGGAAASHSEATRQNSNIIDLSPVLQFSTGLLLDIQKKDRANSILDEMQSLLESEVSQTMEKLAAESIPSSAQVPDDDIVEQLCHRGYSVHGARRAAVATGNAGFREALSWAVMHFRDDNFDLPLVVVTKDRATRGQKDVCDGYVDQRMVQIVRECLSHCRVLIAGDWTNPDGIIFVDGNRNGDDISLKKSTSVDDAAVVIEKMQKGPEQCSLELATPISRPTPLAAVPMDQEKGIEVNLPPVGTTSEDYTSLPAMTIVQNGANKATNPVFSAYEAAGKSKAMSIVKATRDAEKEKAHPDTRAEEKITKPSLRVAGPPSKKMATAKTIKRELRSIATKIEGKVANMSSFNSSGCNCDVVSGVNSNEQLQDSGEENHGQNRMLHNPQLVATLMPPTQTPAPPLTVPPPAPTPPTPPPPRDPATGAGGAVKGENTQSDETKQSAGIGTSTMSRLALRARGEISKAKAKTSSKINAKQLGQEERRKLAMEGRRLLEEARKARQHAKTSLRTSGKSEQPSQVCESRIPELVRPKRVQEHVSSSVTKELKISGGLTGGGHKPGVGVGRQTRKPQHIGSLSEGLNSVAEKYPPTQGTETKKEKETSENGWGWTDEW